jgi:hypothetical protein
MKDGRKRDLRDEAEDFVLAHGLKYVKLRDIGRRGPRQGLTIEWDSVKQRSRR